LLHDIGKFYILNRAHQYQGLFVSDVALWDLVDQWHASIGSAILENWEIDDDIRIAVMDHRLPDLPLSNKPGLTDVVATADLLDAHFVDNSVEIVDWKTTPAAMKNLQLDLKKSEILFEETRLELKMMLQAIA
jgi:HD-like signal output (HDOD) protein